MGSRDGYHKSRHPLDRSLVDKIDVIFLSLLCRKPMASDRSIALRELQEGAASYGNVIWSLLNTREFLFVQ